MSIEGETLQVSVLPYRCSICPLCCVCLGCCAAEFGSSGGTYELPCTADDTVRSESCCALIKGVGSDIHEP
jgi:hypothetical protein